MSHFIVEQGKEVGREVTVPASGIKFGRSPANDLVLEDEVLMLFQGRFFFKSDGTLWVTDFSVEEKSHIGGEPIDERQLKVGDLVEVGTTAFRVISTRQEQDEAAAPPAPVDAEEEPEAIDLGFKPTAAKKEAAAIREPHRKTSPVYRVLQVFAVVLLLLVLGVVATEVMSRPSKSGNGVHMDGIFFRYEAVQGDSDNIFRYALTLTPEGRATLEVDDVLSRHFTRAVQVSPKAIEKLKREISDSAFFKLPGSREGEADNTYELCDIAMGCDGKFKHVRILNREVPPEMSRMVSTLEDFAFDTLNVSKTLLKDDATLIQYAEEAFEVGADHYKSRKTAYGNLATCIRKLRESINYLQTMDPRPEPYNRATVLLERARKDQQDWYEELMFDVEKAENSGDLSEAQYKLRIAAELISDRSDKRYDIITTKQLQVEAKQR